MMLARIEDDPNDDAAPFGRVESVENDRVREGVEREGRSNSGGRDEGRVDRVGALGREVDFLR